MITYIQTLVDSIKDIRLHKHTKSNADFDNRQGLLSAIKVVAKSKAIELENITEDMFLDIVKSRFNKTRSASIMIVSRSDDSNVGSKTAFIILDKDGNEKSITYDELTLEQILSLNPINTSLQSLVKELEYLEDILPKQLTEDEMKNIIIENKLSTIKDIMAYFKANYSNRYNSKLLSSIAKCI